MDQNRNKGPVDEGRRSFLRTGTALGGLTLLGGAGLGSALAETVRLPMANGERPLARYPQKRELLVLTSRPVQLETPMAVFNQGVITPNDAFFVRWHLANVPTRIDGSRFKIRIHGRVKQPLELTPAQLASDFEPVEITAVCQCSGNSRGLFDPRVAGGQWANGAMGNAHWKGVRLREVLAKTGLMADAVQVRFNGAEGPPLPQTPDFMKSLDMDMARSEDVLIAYEMNGKPLPLLNGYPVRLVVPGWYATYWVKMLDDIEVLNHEDQNFWTAKAYRIPANACGCMEPGEKDVPTVPISRMNVRSFITSVADDTQISAGRELTVRGIAFDGGFGIKCVLFSNDGGRHWTQARLGKDHGKYSFREWQAGFQPHKGKSYALLALAINTIGESQRFTPRWNPTGYLRNVVETVKVTAV